MHAVDTNVLVRLITRDDPKQVAAAEAFVSRGAWVPHLAVAEATWILSSVYDRGAEAIATAVEMLLNHEHLTEVARKAGHVPLGTFDRLLGRLNGAQRI